MDSLKTEIMITIEELYPYTTEVIADSILSLVRDFNERELPEFVAAKECKCDCHTEDYCDAQLIAHFDADGKVSCCHGTGRIERRLTVKEVMETFKEILSDKSETILHSYTVGNVLELPSGERVEIRKGGE